MKYDVSVDKNLFRVYPEIRLGLLRFHAEVQEPNDQFWSYMNTEVLPQVRSASEGKEWSELPGIKGSRAAYKAFGRNPGRYRVSSEALIRRVRRGDELHHINSVVDVNNLISVTSGLSVGSYDLGQIHGAVFLQVFQYRITEKKERLRSTHYEEVSETFKAASEAGVEFWEIQMDFRPEGVTLYSVARSEDL